MRVGLDDDWPRRLAGILPDELEPGQSNEDPDLGQEAIGTPGGGAASGGLAGVNLGDGSPDEVDLGRAMHCGRLDHSGDTVDDDDEPQSGRSGGAVGGTPAGKRGRGRNKRAIQSGGDAGFDSTIGQNPRRKPR
jgi:hypothetical protein